MTSKASTTVNGDDHDQRPLPARVSDTPADRWKTISPDDPCIGPTASTVIDAGPAADFHSLRYLHNTARRLEHLATLNLPLRGRRVLEVGAGIGDLTQFFVDRGCRVHATDARADHVAILDTRYAAHPLVSSTCLDLDPPPTTLPERYEVVVCYGVLYHVSDPAAVLRTLALACSDLMLVETIVGDGDQEAINPTPEDARQAGAAFSGLGCRPSRAWVRAQLQSHFPYVYTPRTQPNHYEFPVDWTLASPFARRAIFIGARMAIENGLLTTGLLDRQQRH